MQNYGFQYYFGGVKLNSQRTLSGGNQNKFESANQATKKATFATKTFQQTETFHRMLTFNLLYNIMVNYMFHSYEYIFPRLKFAHKVLTRTCQLTIYKTVHYSVSFIFISLLLAFVKVRKRAKIRNRYNQAPHLTQDTNEKVTTS